ncbi:dihydrolipoamide acetyltransferase family protein [Heyndrickxia acidicola]|uniref:Dihydrolipoamide acetyltransferase component of pyruvate dehydrogenase complex n=1 Tax=Heyndrickxia acidicola TaxID=209389 RepID=A0ABU6MI59_9BACI|nr:dihydrolipoamide acetyltransferase family protein [Heyndrickxia acidicola]MED1204200.1 dihydrolipoamide acetyltransferase family protein [Heyndrickxia acidicola]
MAFVITMPKFGLTMTEGTISHWTKTVGEKVAEGEALYEVETDKITNEVEAPQGGVLRYIFQEAGSTVDVGKPIAIIASETENIDNYLDSTESAPDNPTKEKLSISSAIQNEGENQSHADTYVKATPYAKKVMRDEGVLLEEVTGTGPNGIIVSRDVKTISDSPNKPAISPVAKKYAEEQQINWEDIGQKKRILLPDVIKKQLEVSSGKNGASEEQFISRTTSKPVKGMRKVIAERMTKSWQEIPHVTVTREIDVTALVAAKDVLNKEAMNTNTKITLTHLLIKIVARTLPKHPALNAWFQGKDILYHNDVHIGVAVSVPGGLIVPVIRNVHQKDLLDIADTLRDVTIRAKEQKLRLEETQGATFTISNLGMEGIDHFTPIINPPEIGILGVGRIQEKPVFEGEKVVRRSFMELSLSFDHRALDGADAAHFLRSIDYYIQEPLRLLVKERD